MVILMAGVIFIEPDVDADADADADAEFMLSWEIRLLSGLLKKVNDERPNNQTTPEVRAISAAKTDIDADADADADAAAELSNLDPIKLSWATKNFSLLG